MSTENKRRINFTMYHVRLLASLVVAFILATFIMALAGYARGMQIQHYGVFLITFLFLRGMFMKIPLPDKPKEIFSNPALKKSFVVSGWVMLALFWISFVWAGIVLYQNWELYSDGAAAFIEVTTKAQANGS